jgi:hypothetical protein
MLVHSGEEYIDPTDIDQIEGDGMDSLLAYNGHTYIISDNIDLAKEAKFKGGRTTTINKFLAN